MQGVVRFDFDVESAGDAVANGGGGEAPHFVSQTIDGRRAAAEAAREVDKLVTEVLKLTGEKI